jgi:hypothetical protein
MTRRAAAGGALPGLRRAFGQVQLRPHSNQRVPVQVVRRLARSLTTIALRPGRALILGPNRDCTLSVHISASPR